MGGKSTEAALKRQQQKWSDEEKATFIEALTEYGKDWIKIGELVPKKTQSQIRNFYQNYKHRLGLQEILEKRKEREDKLADTSGGSSGSSGSRKRNSGGAEKDSKKKEKEEKAEEKS